MLRDDRDRVEVDGIAFWVSVIVLAMWLSAAAIWWKVSSSLGRVEALMRGRPPVEGGGRD